MQYNNYTTNTEDCQGKILDNWRVPEPFSEEKNLPNFNPNWLPEPFRAYVQAISEHTQTNPDMSAVTSLGIVSTCVQGKFVIQPKPNYSEPLNLYILISAPPAERKSAVNGHLCEPLNEFEENWNSTHGEKIQLMCNDITPEKLGILMFENKEKISIISTEAGFFKNFLGLYNSGMSNIDILLKAHSGDKIQTDRVTREAILLKNPALTIIVTLQNGIIEEIFKKEELRDCGLLARMLVCKPNSTIGNRKYDTIPINQNDINSYNTNIQIKPL
jgi:hypothetical protein